VTSGKLRVRPPSRHWRSSRSWGPWAPARAQEGNARAEAHRPDLTSVKVALAFVESQARQLRDPSLRSAVRALLANPAPTFMARIPDAAARERALRALADAGFLDPVETANGCSPIIDRAWRSASIRGSRRMATNVGEGNPLPRGNLRTSAQVRGQAAGQGRYRSSPRSLAEVGPIERRGTNFMKFPQQIRNITRHDGATWANGRIERRGERRGALDDRRSPPLQARVMTRLGQLANAFTPTAPVDSRDVLLGAWTNSGVFWRSFRKRGVMPPFTASVELAKLHSPTSSLPWARRSRFARCVSGATRRTRFLRWRSASSANSRFQCRNTSWASRRTRNTT